MNSLRKAFTLIELLIVVAIIAVLAAIAVPNFLEAQVRAKVARARTDMRSLTVALEGYAVDESRYPPMLGNVVSVVSQPENYLNSYGHVRTGGWRGVPQQSTTPIGYLTSLPVDAFKPGIPCKNEYPSEMDQGKPYLTGNPFDATYIYLNIKQLVDVTADPTNPSATYNDQDLAAYGQWRLMSLGPGGTYVKGGNDSVVPLGWIYDPTNGTVSHGMLARSQRDAQVTNATRAQ